MNDEIVKLLKNDLEFTDEYGDKQWVMGVSIREVAKGAYLTRTVVQTNQSPYVDGTDITINIRKGQAEIDLTFMEEAPIFHGGEIEASISWLKENGEIVYSQIENPWAKESYIERLEIAVDEYSFETIGEYNSFDCHVRNIINLQKALLMETLALGVEDILVDGVEANPGQYKLEISIKSQEFQLDINDKHTKADIIEKLVNEIILPLVGVENPEDEKSY